MVQAMHPVAGFWYNDNSGELATLLAANDIDVADFCCCLGQNHVGWHPDNIATVNRWLASHEGCKLRVVAGQPARDGGDNYDWQFAMLE